MVCRKSGIAERLDFSGVVVGVAANGGDDPSLILGPRGVDWGSSLKNVGHWVKELDYRIEGHTYSNNDPSNRAAASVLNIVSQILPSSSIMLNANSLISGEDPINGRELDNWDRWGDPSIGILISPLEFLNPVKLYYEIYKLSNDKTDLVH